MTTKRFTLHGVAIALAVDHDGPLVGIILTGASGVGKSTLALSLIEACPWRRTALVSDDVIEIDAVNDALWGSAPGAIAGLIEIRGVGPVRIAFQSKVKLALAFACQLDPPERLPNRAFVPIEASVVSEASKASKGLAISLPQFPIWLARNGAPDAASQIRLVTRSVLAGQIDP